MVFRKMDIGHCRCAGINSLDSIILRKIQDTPGKIINLDVRLVVADKKNDVMLTFFVFPIIELTLRKLRSFDHMFS